MISSLLAIVIAAIIIGLLWWAFGQLVALVPMPAPAATVINVVVVVLLVIALIYYVLLPVVTLLLGMLGQGVHVR